MTKKMKENRELKKHKDEKLRVLLLTIIAYFVFFVIKKMDIITEYLGIVMLILLYMYANYNLINIFFTSKRTTFKIYAFLLLEVIYLFTGNISMIGTITYIILFLLLIFSVRKDEGRSEIPKITKFVSLFSKIAGTIIELVIPVLVFAVISIFLLLKLKSLNNMLSIFPPSFIITFLLNTLFLYFTIISIKNQPLKTVDFGKILIFFFI